MRIHRSATLALAGLMLASCTAETTSLTPTASLPSATSPASATPGASTPESVEPMPSDELGAFSCELPVIEDATVARAIITDVRVGAHADYDRVVFEFADGLPEITLDRATPPFTQDASGLPVEVDGSSFLRLTMRGGTKQTLDNTSSYDGPTDLDPGFPLLIDLVEGGDFEAQSTWYLGLDGEACVRVLLLTDDGAPRLVIDLEH
jgi:hypothetical protein